MISPKTIAAVALAPLLIGASAPATVDPAAAIAARQAAYRLSAATIGSMKGAIDRGEDVKSLAFPASGIAAWAKALPGLFPAGSDIAPSKAMPAVWSDRAGFEAAAARYAAAADLLVERAKAGDAPGFAAQYAEVGKTCGGCHDTYRQPPPARN